MGWLIVGCMLAALIYGAMVWYANTDVVSVKKALVGLATSGLVILIGLVLINVARGNIGFLPLVIVMVPLIKKLRTASAAHKTYQKFRGQSNSNDVMTRAEALDILGLKEGVSEVDIKAAYRRLMSNVHPDVGGSDWMATKLNEAKRVLLKK